VVAIAGPPNAGKSTLLNRIARREAAIVSPFAGTTRDVIEVHLDLDGWPVTLLDTAGIRDTDDPVELEGVRRAHERAAAADLVLWVVDAREPDVTKNAATKGAAKSVGGAGNQPPVIPGRAAGADPEFRDAQVAPGFRTRRFAAHRNDENSAKSSEKGGPGPITWLIRNKIDLVTGSVNKSELKSQSIKKSESKANTIKSLRNMVNKELTSRSELELTKNELEYNISAVTGEGFDLLLGQLARQAEGFLAGTESALVTRERHRRALEEVLAALRRAQAPDVAGREDLLAEELRIAARALGRLTGRVDVEDILDVIFHDFCIGK